MPLALIYFLDGFSPGSPPPRPTPGPTPPGWGGGPVDPGWGQGQVPVDPGYGRPDWAPGHPANPLPPSPGHPGWWVPGSEYPTPGPLPPGRPDVPALPPHIWGALLRLLGVTDPGYGRPEIPGFKPIDPSWGAGRPPVDPGYGRPGWGPVDPGWGAGRPPVDPGYGRPDWAPGHPGNRPPWAPAYPAPPIYFPDEQPPGGSTKPPAPASIIIYLPGHVPPFIAVPIKPPVPGEPIEIPEQPPEVDNTLPPTAEPKPV